MKIIGRQIIIGIIILFFCGSFFIRKRNFSFLSNQPATQNLIVSSSSMEPAFYGPGFFWKCPHCHYSFRTSLNISNDSNLLNCSQNNIAAQIKSNIRSFLCSNCGNNISIDNASYFPGDIVSAELFDSQNHEIKRFDSVFFLHQNQPIIKRVIGLPGETLEIVCGDIYINGQILKKPINIQNKMLFPVLTLKPVILADRIVWIHYDSVAFAQMISYFESPKNRSSIANETDSLQHLLNSPGDSFELNLLPENENNAFQELNSLLTRLAVPITNQSPRATLNPATCCDFENVRDIVLEFEYINENLQKTEPLKIVIQSGNVFFLLTFDFLAKEIQIFESALIKPIQNIEVNDFPDSPVFKTSCFSNRNRLKSEQSVSLRIGICDRQISISCDQKEQCSFSLPSDVFSSSNIPNSQNLAPIIAPFAIFKQPNAKHSNVVISHPKLYRDVHYSQIDTQKQNGSVLCDCLSTKNLSLAENNRNRWTIPENHYFLLGDNSPVSWDSRFWEPACVPQKSFFGRINR